MKKREEKGGKIIDINRKEIRAKKRKAARRRFICFLAVIAVICFLMTPVFNIDWIDVEGSEKTKPSEIVSVSQIVRGENMFRLNIKKSKEEIRKIPYVKDVKIARYLQGGVRIKITERIPVACIKYANGYALIDDEGRLLETSADRAGYPEIVGIKLAKQKLGDVLKETDEAKITAMTETLAMLNEYELTDRTSLINITKENNVTFVIDENKKVVTGGNYRLDYKLKMLEAAISELAKSEAGTIDLSKEGEALFTPEEQ